MVRKQRVVDNFSGDTLNERWFTNTGTGSPTYTMSDAIDGGFIITNGGSDNNFGTIDFNTIDQFNSEGESLIGVIQPTSTTFRRLWIGMLTGNNGTPLDYAFYNDDTDDSFSQIESRDNGGTATTTDTTLTTAHNSKKTIQLTISATNIRLFVNGNFTLLKTSDLPSQPHMPSFLAQNRSASSRVGRIIYLEAWNT